MKKFRQFKAFTCLFLATAVGFVQAADITTSVDLNNSANDTLVNLDLSSMLPVANDNTWVYDRSDYNYLTNGSTSITATVGKSEVIGGGCLKVNPIVFGGDLILYLGNYGDSLSLYGIYLAHWKGLNDVLLKFETRSRIEWLDFKHHYYNEQITPIDQYSCQDTERGRVEGTGLVILEDLTENLGEPTNKTGVIDCRPKNTDLRDEFVNGGQHGSGLATIAGETKALNWTVDSITLTDQDGVSPVNPGGPIRIQMDFRPKIVGDSNDYSMYIDMTLVAGQGITNLSVNSTEFVGITTKSNLKNGDLFYDNVVPNLASATNTLSPKGTCPEDNGSLSLYWVLVLFSFTALRRRQYLKV